MSIVHVRLSQQAKDQLSKLKRTTGITNWNILCRWAFCLSLADLTPPSPIRGAAENAIEMDWKVFGGSYQEVYLAALKQRCHMDGLGTSDEVLAAQLRLHLHRGIGRLAADRDIKSISDLIARAVPIGPPSIANASEDSPA